MDRVEFKTYSLCYSYSFINILVKRGITRRIYEILSYPPTPIFGKNKKFSNAPKSLIWYFKRKSARWLSYLVCISPRVNWGGGGYLHPMDKLK